jgi:preprotein translocase subunit SecG
MDILLIVLVVLIIIDCVLIVISILFQEDKSGGGIGILGGSSQSFFGAASGNLLAKITTVLLVIFLLLSVVIAFVSSRNNSSITAQDITKSQTTDNLVGVKKDLTKAPTKILAEIFDKEIISKINNEQDKKFISDNYAKDSSNKFFSLKNDIKTNDEKRIISILNSIKFSPESQTTVISSSDLSGDASNDTTDK